VHRAQRLRRGEHAAAAGTQHVPAQLEQAEPRGMQERADRLFLGEAALGGEGQHIDPAEIAIAAVADQALDLGHDAGIGRRPQGFEQSLRVAHGAKSKPKSSDRQGAPCPALAFLII
jgi:hypothetical protein